MKCGFYVSLVGSAGKPHLTSPCSLHRTTPHRTAPHRISSTTVLPDASCSMLGVFVVQTSACGVQSAE
ncbi:hypothetical protein CC80DRAFT_489175 [Byssothecium circinans]|uniref:Uncharacterized protein n=1 Tax=Byssothecium circinans TaxID=147558 RepID=A0A6A5U730_9PLEO|nr:hypothetical protein CC80DRAFT_489175 [Byssothecium circinans]